MVNGNRVRGCLVRLSILAMAVSVAMTNTRVAKYRIHHTYPQYFSKMSTHMGYA